MISAYQNIWFCGLAASGKTMILRLLSQELTGVEFLNDSLEMVDFIKADREQKHHTKPTEDSFVLKDSEPVKYAVAKLIEKAGQSSSTKIIELSRGFDKQGVVDFSYKYLLSQLTEDLKQNSLFVYVYAPLEERRIRNAARPALSADATVFESFFCPDEAFERFFTRDDFFEAVERSPVDFLFIPNIYSQDYLMSKILKLFTEK